MKENKKFFGLDLVRAIAIMLVFAVHYFLGSSYYITEMQGAGMLILTALRSIAYTCVPLFMVLTGYLKSKNKGFKQNYKSLLQIIVSYFIISLLLIIYIKYINRSDKDIIELFMGILSFEYSWYVEMYIGLFLLIPFLNILYNGIDSQKKKIILIITLLFLCSLPPLINPIKLDNLFLDIIPNWWIAIYPILYYFIGAYIREYGIRISKQKLLILSSIVIFLQSFLMYSYDKGANFSWRLFDGYNAFPTVILTTIFFLIFYDVKINIKWFQKIINLISKLSLKMYLFGAITDSIVYYKLLPYLNISIAFKPRLMLLYFVPLFILSFLIAFIFSYILEISIALFKKAGNYLKEKYVTNEYI